MRKSIKRFERGADVCRDIPDGTLVLCGSEVYVNDSEVLYEVDEFTQEIFERDFDIKSGEWKVEDGWIIGKNPEMCPGMIVSKADYFGSVMLECTVKMIPPSTHDINIMINGSWDEVNDKRDLAYVTGMEAFWHGNIGFEKSPEYKLVAATQLFDFDPDIEHTMLFGNMDGRIFVINDGKLCLEVFDPDPIDTSKYGKIGFEAFSSWFKVKNIKVRKINYKKIPNKYIREF